MGKYGKKVLMIEFLSIENPLWVTFLYMFIGLYLTDKVEERLITRKLKKDNLIRWKNNKQELKKGIRNSKGDSFNVDFINFDDEKQILSYVEFITNKLDLQIIDKKYIFTLKEKE